MEEMSFVLLRDLLERKQLSIFSSTISGYNPVDVAQFIEELPPEEMLLAFRLLPKDLSADVFSYMDPDSQEHIVGSISDREIRVLIDEMYLDDTVDFLEEVPAIIVKRVLRNTDENTRRLINQFLNYPDNSAGSIMTIELVDLKATDSVEEALADIRRTGVDKETIDPCFVIDHQRHLMGTVALRKLLLSKPDTLVGDIMEENVISVQTLDDQEAVADTVRKYDLMSIPVVDNEDRLVGIITVDDILDIIEEENTEDFEKMAALKPAEDEYLKTSPVILAKNRIVWLLVLMISATLTGTIIQYYDGLLSQSLVLAAFIPMLMDTGGNCGSQVATLIIRGMALGEINLKDIWRVLWKELRVAIIVGITLAVVNYARMAALGEGDHLVRMVVSLCLICTVVLAKVIGGLLPLLAKICRFDPALMASPLITTIVDTVTLIIYFAIARALLGLS